MLESIQKLEDRKLLSVSMGSDGYTKVTASSDSKLIYVSSSSGNDKNPGTQAKPIKTLAKAKTLVRDKKPDWVLLKKGDSWKESFPDWVFSGRSAQEPTVITSYGSGARPKILTGSKGGITIAQKYSNPLNYVAVIGLHFYADGYDGWNGTTKTAGIRVMRKGSDVLLEDNYIQGFKDNVVIDPDGSLKNVKIRRNVIVDAWNADGGRAQGIYGGANADGTLIEENVLDHNGWKEGVKGAGATMFNHSIYFNTGSTGLVVRGNIIARSSLFGVMSRGGGVVENNLIVRSPTAIQVGGGSATIKNNVILESNDLPTQKLGKAIEVYSVSKATIEKNLMAHDVSAGTYGIAVNVRDGVSGGTLKSNIVYDWRKGFTNAGKLSQSGNQVTLKGQTGSYKYVDPTRTLGKYNATLGRTNSLVSFLSYARQQAKGAWNAKYTSNTVGNYIRGGFALKSAAKVASLTSVSAAPVHFAAISVATSTTPARSAIFGNTAITDDTLLTA